MRNDPVGLPRRLNERIDQMHEAGRMTDEQVERVREAAGSDRLGGVVRAIRLEHVTDGLDAAVRDGCLSREDADGFRRRLERGERLSILPGFLRPPGRRGGEWR